VLGRAIAIPDLDTPTENTTRVLLMWKTQASAFISGLTVFSEGEVGLAVGLKAACGHGGHASGQVQANIPTVAAVDGISASPRKGSCAGGQHH
jgi:hypothetical protein